jgi:hypothetical protein
MCHVTFFKDFSDVLGTLERHFFTIMIKIYLYPGPMFIKSIRKLSNILIKATKGIIFNFKKCHVTQGGGGGVWKNVTKCHTGGGKGSKKCQKSVTYYLNGPLHQPPKGFT